MYYFKTSLISSLLTFTPILCSLLPTILNQDSLNCDNKALLYGSRTDNEIRLSVPVEEELYQLSIQQPSYPPMLSQVHVDRPIFSSRVADSKPECDISDIDHYRRVDVVSSNCKFYLYKIMALFASYSLAKIWVLCALYFYFEFWPMVSMLLMSARGVDSMFPEGCWGKYHKNSGNMWAYFWCAAHGPRGMFLSFFFPMEAWTVIWLDNWHCLLLLCR